MVINIDIRIADSDGNVLHRFENQLDEKDASLGRQDNNGLGKNFEDFLAEYLSYSGFALREKLIKDNYVTSNLQEEANLTEYPNQPDEEITADSLNNSELEYRIRVGSNKVLIGKIPLKLQSFLSAEVLDECNNETEATHKTTKGSASKPAKKDSFQLTQPANSAAASQQCLNRNYELKQQAYNSSDNKETSPDNEEAVIDKIINYAMVKAIEKYEANLYQVYDEDDCNDRESSLSIQAELVN